MGKEDLSQLLTCLVGVWEVEKASEIGVISEGVLSGD